MSQMAIKIGDAILHTQIETEEGQSFLASDLNLTSKFNSASGFL
jgi:hypothetical protein